MLPPDVHAYLCTLGSVLRARLDGALAGVYAGGSIALGAYVPGESDIDVAVVSRGPLRLADKHAVVGDVRHESLPCPARGLRLVVYCERAAGEPSREPGFELELGTGPGVPFQAALDASRASGGHRHVLDRAILARHGVTLVGPHASALFAHVPRELVLAALVDSVRRHAAQGAPGGAAVAAACRALRYAVEDRWTSGAEARRWAAERLGDAELVAAAPGVPDGRDACDAARTKRFLEQVEARLAHFLPRVRDFGEASAAAPPAGSPGTADTPSKGDQQ